MAAAEVNFFVLVAGATEVDFCVLVAETEVVFLFLVVVPATEV